MTHYSDKHYTPSDDYDKFYYDILFKKGQRILDIGCSTGNFISQDRENITGIDIDADAVKIAKKRGFRASVHDVSKKFPFESGSIENVHCRHVIEHLEDSLSFMKEIFRILKKNGRLVLLTDKMTPHFWDDYTHKRPFTTISLGQLAYDSGFRKYKVYDFPSEGVFGLGFLYRHRMISSKSALLAYKLAGKVLGTHSLVLEASK